MIYGFRPENWPAFQAELQKRGISAPDIEKVEMRPTEDPVVLEDRRYHGHPSIWPCRIVESTSRSGRVIPLADLPFARNTRSARIQRMDPHERATSVWYRVAGLLRRKDLAIEIVEAEIRSAQQEILLEPGA